MPIHTCRTLGGLSAHEGEIEVAVEETSNGHWLHVTDTGIGMSRYVLTEVLLDFGRSLWKSADLRGEWSGLSSSGFEAIGQFGIGFFSVFMLGDTVRVITRRYEIKAGEQSQWLLEFHEGTSKRPVLREPIGPEQLKRHGTRVSVLLTQEKLSQICKKEGFYKNQRPEVSLAQACARLTPAIDVELFVRDAGNQRVLAVKTDDWFTLPAIALLKRINPGHYESPTYDNFGYWSHLSDILDSRGNTVGRCSVQPELYLGIDAGIGVVKGIFAGAVEGLAGVIYCRPQGDLARRESIPAISLSNLQQWAESQKKMLIEKQRIKASQSALLAFFGATYSGLILGDLGGDSVSFEDFIERARELNEIVVHDGDVSYEEDDDVIQKEFDDNFDVCYNVLELSSVRRPPTWWKEIEHDIVPGDSWSLDGALHAALKQAWGEVDWDEYSVIVGDVNGVDVERDCRVAKRALDNHSQEF